MTPPHRHPREGGDPLSGSETLMFRMPDSVLLESQNGFPPSRE
ncbi:hypothetical protein [Halopseudomonas salina]|nr:hypothetical protein [Halopseudomonas salina]